MRLEREPGCDCGDREYSVMEAMEAKKWLTYELDGRRVLCGLVIEKKGEGSWRQLEHSFQMSYGTHNHVRWSAGLRDGLCIFYHAYPS